MRCRMRDPWSSLLDICPHVPPMKPELPASPGPWERCKWTATAAKHLLGRDFQLTLEDFAGRAYGERIAKFDGSRVLVGRHLIAAPVDQRLRRDLAPGAADDERLDLFAKALVRDADDGGECHRRMRQHHFLDFARIDVEPAANDHVLLAID